MEWELCGIWFKIFVDNVSKSKIIVEGSNTHSYLQESIHPSQLEKKFGGEAENITNFWPPYSPSHEYGIDLSKLQSSVLSSYSEKSNGSANENMKNLVVSKSANPLNLTNSKLKPINSRNVEFSNQINFRPNNQPGSEDNSSNWCWSIF